MAPIINNNFLNMNFLPFFDMPLPMFNAGMGFNPIFPGFLGGFEKKSFTPMPIIDFSLMPPSVGTQPKEKKEEKTSTLVDSDKTFDKVMEYVFKDEGGYVNHPKDPGGATNMGVTQKTYDGYCKQKGIPSKSVKDLTREEAKQLYYELFWGPSGAKELAESGDEKLAYVVFDTAIHSGIPRAKKLLAQSNGDAEKMLDKRLTFMKGLSNWDTFGRGWTNRIDKIDTRIEYMA